MKTKSRRSGDGDSSGGRKPPAANGDSNGSPRDGGVIAVAVLRSTGQRAVVRKR